MNFALLTDTGGHPVAVNFDLVRYVYKTLGGTRLMFDEEQDIVVSESFDEILILIEIRDEDQ